MWDFEACICAVGLFMRMSLFGLHSCIDIVRLVIFKGGCMKLCPLSGYN